MEPKDSPPPYEALALMDDDESELMSCRSGAFPLMDRRGPLREQNKAWWVDKALQRDPTRLALCFASGFMNPTQMLMC